MRHVLFATAMLFGALVLIACDDVQTERPTSDVLADQSGDAAGDQNGDVTISKIPLAQRTVAAACDNVRPTTDPGAPTTGDPYIQCTTHAECTEGLNGRCGGNGHDGWYCTYDLCFADSECGAFVCECEGGFRSDNNVCLSEGNCRSNADCGTDGYCSPTLGDCGDYSGTVGYYCHTPQDECTNDTDCGDGTPGGSYCAYNSIAGKWMCSNSQCVG